MPHDSSPKPAPLGPFLEGTTLERTARAWEAILPGVDGSAIPLIARIEAAARWLGAFKAGILSPFGLNFSEWMTLATLRVAGDDARCSPTELRGLVGQTSAGMTRILGKLEAHGWVVRTAHAEDGRRIDVVLTEAGCRLAEESFAVLQNAQAEVLAALADDAREGLVRQLDGLLAIFAAAGEHTRPPPSPGSPSARSPSSASASAAAPSERP